jgi:hypothetical protein
MAELYIGLACGVRGDPVTASVAEETDGGGCSWRGDVGNTHVAVSDRGARAGGHGCGYW